MGYPISTRSKNYYNPAGAPKGEMHSSGLSENASHQGFRGYLRGPFLLAMTAAIVSTLDPLGIEEATGARSEQAAMRLASTFYPGFHSAGDQVTVVLLDEEYAKRTGGTWPVSYRQQGHLLSLIDGLKPAAIFVDLLYKKPHEDASNPRLKGDDPGNLLGALPADTVTPIYLAGLAASNPAGLAASSPNEHSYCESTGQLKPLDSLLDKASVLESIGNDPLIKDKGRIALVEWNRCRDLYPLYLGDNPQAATPAYAMYREWICKGKDRDKCLREWSNDEYADPMKVLWGAFPPRAQAGFYSENACQYGYKSANEAHPWWRRPGATLNQLWLAALGQDYAARSKNDRLPCPALTVIPAAAFVGAEPDSEEFQSRMGPLLTGRLVLVGASILGAKDTIVSPVHGQIPGVEFHAMALDNLVRFGPSYTSEAPEWVMRYVLPAFVLALFAWLAYWLPLWKWRRSLEIGGLILLGTIAVAFALRHIWIKPFFAIVGGAALYMIAPTAVVRAALALLFVITVAIIAIWCGFSPSNWLVLAIAVVLVCEKVYDETHGPREAEIVNRRIERIRGAFARGFAVLARKNNVTPDTDPAPKEG